MKLLLCKLITVSVLSWLNSFSISNSTICVPSSSHAILMTFVYLTTIPVIPWIGSIRTVLKKKTWLFNMMGWFISRFVINVACFRYGLSLTKCGIVVFTIWQVIIDVGSKLRVSEVFSQRFNHWLCRICMFRIYCHVISMSYLWSSLYLNIL